MLAKGGLTMKDIDPVYMANSQMAAAFANKALDAALPTEPGVSLALRTGDVQKVLEDYDVYPRHEIAVVLYSGKFSKEKPEAATAFLRAYLHGVRDYLEAIVQGRFTGPKGDEMVSLLTQFGPSKDPDFYRSFKVGYCDPDGRLHLKSLAEDLAAYKKANLIQGQVTLEQAVDTSFLEAALKQVGTYGKPLK
jgi:NitT/TauT family transport system substrate-binding protein